MTTSPFPRRVESAAATLDAATERALYEQSGASRWGLTLAVFSGRLRTAVASRLRAGEPLRDHDAFARSLHVADLALACACADGHEPAWEHFVRELRPSLYAAARQVAPAHAEELADSLFAELFGLETRDGRRRSLLDYYHGRARLSTWLRTVLVQRHVDRLRSGARTVPLSSDDGHDVEPVAPTVAPNPDRGPYVAMAQAALSTAMQALDDRTRLCLRLYYQEGLTLARIGRLTKEHEATISRKLDRARRDIRHEVERLLRERHGLPAAAVTECLAAAADAPEIEVLNLLDPQESGTRRAELQPDGGPTWRRS